jgi:hypothetical protein
MQTTYIFLSLLTWLPSFFCLACIACYYCTPYAHLPSNNINLQIKKQTLIYHLIHILLTIQPPPLSTIIHLYLTQFITTLLHCSSPPYSMIITCPHPPMSTYIHEPSNPFKNHYQIILSTSTNEPLSVLFNKVIKLSLRPEF